MASRKEMEEELFTFIEEISDKSNSDRYRKVFKEMNDSEFNIFVDRVEAGKINLAVVQPTGIKNTVTVEKTLAVAEKYGIKLLDKVVFKDDAPYIPNLEMSILRLPDKRTVQTLASKIGVPEDSKTIDTITGQVTGKSSSSKITLPEAQLLDSLGLKDSLIELMKIRGGDQGALRTYNAMLENQGSANQEIINRFGTGVVSGKVLEAMFNSMLLDINLTNK